MKKVSKRSGKVGLPPGSFVHVGAANGENATLQLFEYDQVRVSEREFRSLNELVAAPEEGTMRWLNINGLHDESLMQAVVERFDLHSLVVEDILNTDHRPKVEEYQDSLFVVAKMLRTDPQNGSLQVEQISFVLLRGMLISFQERNGDVLEPVRERLRKGVGRTRKSGVDYLLYALLDVIVDHYFVVLEELLEGSADQRFTIRNANARIERPPQHHGKPIDRTCYKALPERPSGPYGVHR